MVIIEQILAKFEEENIMHILKFPDSFAWPRISNLLIATLLDVQEEAESDNHFASHFEQHLTDWAEALHTSAIQTSYKTDGEDAMLAFSAAILQVLSQNTQVIDSIEESKTPLKNNSV